MQHAYMTHFSPLCCAFAGLHEPFSQPMLMLVQQIFDLTYPDEDYNVVKDECFLSW